jgi:GNAT superfamily N-acetyltransferase
MDLNSESRRCRGCLCDSSSESKQIRDRDLVNEENPEWTIDFDAIIRTHLARRPSRVRPGLGFAIPMSEEEWWGFPRMPGWKYEYSIREGAVTQIRPFGPHYRITVERRAVTAPCEIRSVRWRDVPALRRAFAEAFADYTDYIYSAPEQILRLGGALLRKFFARAKDDLCRQASCLAIDPDNPIRVVGAALLAPANGVVRRLPESVTQLQPVFVVPGWQRRGVATALVSEVLRRLWNAGQESLVSGCSDYNVVSKRWHLAFGVTEERCYYAWRPLFYWVRNEISRRAYLEKTRGIPFESLDRANLERWFIALADEWDALERESPGLIKGTREIRVIL